MEDGFNLDNLLGKAQEFQKQMQDKQKESQQKEYESSIGGGMVKVTCNGTPNITSITLDESLLQENKSDIEEMIKLGVNEVLKQVDKGFNPQEMLSNVDIGSVLKNLKL